MVAYILIIVLVILLLITVGVLFRQAINKDQYYKNQCESLVGSRLSSISTVRNVGEKKKVFGSYQDVMLSKEENMTDGNLPSSTTQEQQKLGYKFMFNEFEGRTAPNYSGRQDRLPCSVMQTATLRDGYH